MKIAVSRSFPLIDSSHRRIGSTCEATFEINMCLGASVIRVLGREIFNYVSTHRRFYSIVVSQKARSVQQPANLSLFRSSAHPVNRHGAPRAPEPRSDCDAPSTRCIPPIPLTAVSPEFFHPFTRETTVTSPPEKFICTPGRERTNNQRFTIRTRELLVSALCVPSGLILSRYDPDPCLSDSRSLTYGRCFHY